MSSSTAKERDTACTPQEKATDAPKERSGNIMKCRICDGEEHLMARCPQGNGKGKSSDSSGAPPGSFANLTGWRSGSETGNREAATPPTQSDSAGVAPPWSDSHEFAASQAPRQNFTIFMASSGSPNYDPMTFNDPWIQSSSLTMNANKGPSGVTPEEYDIASTYSQVAAAVAASQQAPGTPVQSYPWMQQTNFHENLDFMPTAGNRRISTRYLYTWRLFTDASRTADSQPRRTDAECASSPTSGSRRRTQRRSNRRDVCSPRTDCGSQRYGGCTDA